MLFSNTLRSFKELYTMQQFRFIAQAFFFKDWTYRVIIFLGNTNADINIYYFYKFVTVIQCFCLFPHFCTLSLSETALKLDSLIGDIEDAVSSTMTKNLKKYYSTQNSEVSSRYVFRGK